MDYLVSDHFAKVYIYLASTSHTKLVSVPKISIAALFAQLGGILNLWSGISVVLVVEFLDFLFKVAMSSDKNNDEKKTNENKDRADRNVSPSHLSKYSSDNQIETGNMPSGGKYIKRDQVC